MKRLTFVVLRMERLVLCQLRESESMDGVGEMAGWASHKTREEMQAVFTAFVIGKQMLAVNHGGKVIGSLGIEKYDEDKFPEFSGSGLVLLRPGISPTIRRLGECRKNAVPFLCLF